MSGHASTDPGDLPTQSERDRDAQSDDPQQSIQEEDLHSPIGSSPHATIYKIPNFLKWGKREKYVPQTVSLGPYHHGSAELSSMEQCKGRVLGSNNVIFAHSARNAIQNRESEIRACYEKRIDYDGNTLSKMLFLDGCFILDVLEIYAYSTSQPYGINATYFGGNKFAASNTLRDILMLENQVPLIVLRELQELKRSETSLFYLMLKVSCALLKTSNEGIGDLTRSDYRESAVEETPHLLGFLHKVIVDRPSDQANPEHGICIGRCFGGCLQMLPDENKTLNHRFIRIPPAVELKNAGIKFRPYNGGIKHIKFDPNSSTIYLPLLYLTYNTEVLLLNLMAFEICSESQVNYVSSYLILMDQLIDSEKDVAFLRTTGILTNLLGSDKDVADLFNHLFMGFSRPTCMFDELKRFVNANYKNRCRVRLAELWRDHLSSPWKAIALLVAFVILCLNLIQTIYTVKAVFPSN